MKNLKYGLYLVNTSGKRELMSRWSYRPKFRSILNAAYVAGYYTNNLPIVQSQPIYKTPSAVPSNYCLLTSWFIKDCPLINVQGMELWAFSGNFWDMKLQFYCDYPLLFRE